MDNENNFLESNINDNSTHENLILGSNIEDAIEVPDFSYDGFNSNNYDFLIGKFNDFIYVEFIINNMIFIYSKNVIKI